MHHPQARGALKIEQDELFHVNGIAYTRSSFPDESSLSSPVHLFIPLKENELRNLIFSMRVGAAEKLTGRRTTLLHVSTLIKATFLPDSLRKASDRIQLRLLKWSTDQFCATSHSHGHTDAFSLFYSVAGEPNGVVHGE